MNEEEMENFFNEGYFFKQEVVKTVCPLCRVRARIRTTSKTEFFVIIVTSWKPLTVFRKNLILVATGALVLPLLFPLL